MQKVIETMEQRRVELGLTKQQLADAVHKDLRTVCKQLSVDDDDSGIKLSTLMDYAEALDGDIVFLTSEQIAEQEHIHDMRHRIALYEEAEERWHKHRNDLQKQIGDLAAAQVRLAEVNEEQRKTIRRKEEMIEKLLDKFVLGK